MRDVYKDNPRRGSQVPLPLSTRQDSFLSRHPAPHGHALRGRGRGKGSSGAALPNLLRPWLGGWNTPCLILKTLRPFPTRHTQIPNPSIENAGVSTVANGRGLCPPPTASRWIRTSPRAGVGERVEGGASLTAAEGDETVELLLTPSRRAFGGRR